MNLKKLPIHLILSLIAVIFIVPLLTILSTSFKTSTEIYSASFSLIPQTISLDNFSSAIKDIDFFSCFFNTAYIAVINILTVTLGSALSAYAFLVLDINKGLKSFLFVLSLSIMMLPDMVILVPQFMLFKWLGFYGNKLPLLLPYIGGLPFYIFLLYQFFTSVPKDLRESAKLDGATEFQIWWEIYMPIAKPAILVVVLLQFLLTWNDLIKPSVFLINEKHYTLSLALEQYVSRLGGAEWGPLMASVVLMILPVIILFLFTQKSFIQGLSFKGIKG